MTTLGRIKQGNLMLSGEVNERLPAVTNGLIAHFPFDGTERGITPGNLYWDDSEWTTIDFVDGKTYPIAAGTYNTIILEAQIYLEGTPSERYTILQVHHPSGSMYLSIDSNRKVSVYDHSKTSNGYHASNKTIALNEWHTVTHLNTPSETVIIIDGRIDRVISNTDDADKSLTGDLLIGAESASRHFQGKIRNIRVGIGDPRPSTNTDTTLTYEGIAVEEATTNISPRDGDFSSCEGEHVGDPALPNSNHTYLGGEWKASTHYNDGICKVIKTMTPGGWGKALRWIHGSVEGWKGITSTASFTAEAGKTYTFSVWVRVSDSRGTPSAYAFYNSSAGHTHYFSWEKSPANYPNEWVRGTFTFTPDTTVTGWVYLYGESSICEGLLIDYWGYQIEEKGFATSFVDGSRSGNGNLDIPIECWGQEGTISVEVASSYDLKVESSGVGDRGIIRSDTTSGLLLYLNDGDHLNNVWGAGSTSGPDGLTWKAGEFHKVALTFSKSNSIRKLYLDGVKVGEGSGWSADYTWSYLQLGTREGGTYCGDYIFRNASFYNRELSEAEIKKLHDSRFHVTPAGNIIVPKVKEFPTDSIDPVSSMNWAQSEYNLLNPDFTTFTGSGSNETKDFFGHTVPVRNMSNTSNWECYSPHVVVNPYNFYVFSIWIYTTQKLDGRFYLGLHTYDSSGNTIPTIQEGGSGTTNPYFWYSDDLASNPNDSKVKFNQWFQVRGYLFPDTVSLSDVSHLDNFWVDDYIQEAYRFEQMTSNTAEVHLRFLDYYNETTQSYSWWALPCITPMSPVRFLKDKTLTYKIKEGIPL